MTTSVSVNVSMPRADVAFMRQLGKRMGWSVSKEKQMDNLYDPESGAFLNDETMQAIRDIEAGKSMRCKNMDELLASI